MGYPMKVPHFFDFLLREAIAHVLRAAGIMATTTMLPMVPGWNAQGLGPGQTLENE